jgi:hypothetical protein
MGRVRKGEGMKETERKREKIAKEDKHIDTHWEMDQLFYKYSRNHIETISSALTLVCCAANKIVGTAPTCSTEVLKRWASALVFTELKYFTSVAKLNPLQGSGDCVYHLL